jgi:hypothetical protein
VIVEHDIWSIVSSRYWLKGQTPTVAVTEESKKEQNFLTWRLTKLELDHLAATFQLQFVLQYKIKHGRNYNIELKLRVRTLGTLILHNRDDNQYSLLPHEDIVNPGIMGHETDIIPRQWEQLLQCWNFLWKQKHRLYYYKMHKMTSTISGRLVFHFTSFIISFTILYE